MVRAVDPKKITDIAGVIDGYKRKAKNIRLNLSKGIFEVMDAKGKVAKTIQIAKGYDAVLVIQNSVKAEDIASSSEYLRDLRKASTEEAGDTETEFAELQDQLMDEIRNWEVASPGASRASLAIEIGRLQRNIARKDGELRNLQYKYREALDVEGAKRRLFSPLSFDDRGTPYPVYKLNQLSNLSTDRVVPVDI